MMTCGLKSENILSSLAPNGNQERSHPAERADECGNGSL